MKLYLIIIFLFLSKIVNANTFDQALKDYNNENYEAAFKQFLTLAENGDEEAIFRVGVMYMDGEGVEQNCTEAIRWYKKLAEKDHLDSIFNIGIIYNAGTCIEGDNLEALKWYNKAADLGDDEALYYAAQIYSDMKEYKKSFEYFLESSLLNNSYSMYNVGYQYYYGHGVRRDYFKSYIWIKLAILSGNDDEFTNENLKIVKERLNWKRLQIANEKVEECFNNDLSTCA